MQAAIERAMRVIIDSGKAAGTLTSDPALARRYLDLGCTFVATGVDVLLYANSARRLAASFLSADTEPATRPASAAY
ncbi:4-hydroxy-2-oxo-heptane-1,7-dioate aldolase [compost metagenome]